MEWSVQKASLTQNAEYLLEDRRKEDRSRHIAVVCYRNILCSQVME